jgi:hypothetical protein
MFRVLVLTSLLALVLGLELVQADGEELDGRKEAAVLKCACGDEAKLMLDATSTSEGVAWANENYPDTDPSLDCSLTVTRAAATDDCDKICQIKVTVEELSLKQPKDGTCMDDVLEITGSDCEPTNYCGEEALADGAYGVTRESKPMNSYHTYHQFTDDANDEIVLNITTNGEDMARKFKVWVQPIKCDSDELAPPGCNQFFVLSPKLAPIAYGNRSSTSGSDDSIVVKSQNYPKALDSGIGVIDNEQEMTHCFAVRDAKINSLTFDPEDHKFLLGTPGPSKQDSKCASTALVAPEGRTNGKYSKYCGGYFNPKANQEKNSAVWFKSGPKDYYKVTVTGGPKGEQGGYRFKVSTDTTGLVIGFGGQGKVACIGRCPFSCQNQGKKGDEHTKCVSDCRNSCING